ncbi:MAG: hypothetical protein ACFB2X_10930 [Rivularia sp. (in: cyanobacteria)]
MTPRLVLSDDVKYAIGGGVPQLSGLNTVLGKPCCVSSFEKK